MMSKFLLFLCFTAVHVLGEDQQILPSKSSDVLLANVKPSQNNTEHFDVKSPLSKTVPPERVPVPPITEKNKSKSEEISTTPSSVQNSTDTPTYSTVVSEETKATALKNDSTTQQIPHTTVKPAVVHVPINPAAVGSYSAGKWVVNDTNKICVMVQMSVVFNISYTNVNRTMSSMVFDIPTDNATTASGHCDNGLQNLTLTWSSKNITNASMTMSFTKNINDSYYSFHSLRVILPAVNFPKNTLNESLRLVYESPENKIGLSRSYRCLKSQEFNLTQDGTNQTFGHVTISDLQFQAFKADNSIVFGLAKDCAFDTPDVVPIAVGCALAGLVFVVLIAYLIGRRRSQMHGYSSM